MDDTLEREVSQLFSTVESLQLKSKQGRDDALEGATKRIDELQALVATLEAELKVARDATPREVEREVARRMRPLLEQTTGLASEVPNPNTW